MKRPALWPGMVFALLGMNVCIVGVTVLVAHSDPSFGVEPDYYAKAADWNTIAAQRQASLRLGWRADLPPTLSRARPLELRLTDRDGAPVPGARVRVESFHHARSRDRFRDDLTEVAPGLYRSEALAPAATGVWEFRVRADRGDERFAADLTHVVVPEEPRP